MLRYISFIMMTCAILLWPALRVEAAPTSYHEFYNHTLENREPFSQTRIGYSIDNTNPQLGSSVDGFVTVDTGENIARDVTVNVYRVSSENAPAAGPTCPVWDVDSGTLLATVDIDDASSSSRVMSDFKFVADAEFGFTAVSNVSRVNQNIVYVIVDPENSLKLDCTYYSTPVTVLPPGSYVDIQLSNLTAPSSVSRGNSFDVSFDVTNAGAIEATGGKMCLYSERAMTNILFGTTGGNCVDVRALAAGETTRVEISNISEDTFFGFPHMNALARLTEGTNTLVVRPDSQTFNQPDADPSDNWYQFDLSYGVVSEPVVTSPEPVVTDTNVEGRLVRSSLYPSVYWVRTDGKRHPFTNRTIYSGWFSDFSAVENISVSEMQSIPLGAPVSVRPGNSLVKFPYDNKVYEVVSYGVIKHLTDQASAVAGYGSNWESKIVLLPEIYSLFYTVQ